MRLSLPLVLGALLLGGALRAAPPELQPLPERRPTPLPLEPPAAKSPAARLSPATRAALRARMQSHAENFTALLDASVRVDYARIAEAAERIEKHRGPVGDDPAELKAALPRFPELQEELRARAREVSTAAREHQPDRLAKAVSELSGTCVRCHALYRE